MTVGQCGCPACDQFLELCWTRLSDGTWVLSLRERLFDAADVLAALDPDGECEWFLDDVPSALPPSEAAT